VAQQLISRLTTFISWTVKGSEALQANDTQRCVMMPRAFYKGEPTGKAIIITKIFTTSLDIGYLSSPIRELSAIQAKVNEISWKL
jgi:hypothetical protein